MSLFNAYLALSGAYDADIERDVPCARLTGLRVGGPASLVATAHSYHALARVFEILKQEGVPWVVLGRGTAVLASDDGFPGCVVRLGREFARISVGEGDGLLSAGAGALLSKVANAAYQNGLSGLEPLTGIPGTLGGAVSMNAGSRRQWLGEHVQSLVCFRPGEGMVRRQGSDIEWGYRRTSLPSDELVLEATFSLDPVGKPEVGDRSERELTKRRRSQPGTRACTCEVFLDAGDQEAARLLATSGVAGWGVGGAVVAPGAPNFVANDGRATAREVLEVIHGMRDKVKEAHGVQLKPQIKFLGFSE